MDRATILGLLNHGRDSALSELSLAREPKPRTLPSVTGSHPTVKGEETC